MRRISEPFDIPDRAGMPGATPDWIKTPPASRGSAGRVITSAQGQQTIAQFEINHDVCPGEAVAATMQMEVNIPPSALTAKLSWVIAWGYGGVQYQRTVHTQIGRITVTGDWFRINALLQNDDGTATIHTCTVSASITPVCDGQTRWGSGWNENQALVAGSQTYNSADGYVLSPGPCTLWRVGGYNYGPNTDYIMLFDETDFPPVAGSGIPSGVIGVVGAGSTFSMDVSLSGRDYETGLVIASSSTPAAYTQDAAALLMVDCELLRN